MERAVSVGVARRRTHAARTCAFELTCHASAESAERQRASPSTGRSRSPASSIALRACPLECGAFLRGRTRLRRWRVFGLDAGHASPSGWCRDQACPTELQRTYLFRDEFGTRFVVGRCMPRQQSKRGTKKGTSRRGGRSSAGRSSGRKTSASSKRGGARRQSTSTGSTKRSSSRSGRGRGRGSSRQGQMNQENMEE